MSVIEVTAGSSDSLDSPRCTHFISDLHLDPTRADVIELSLRYFAHVQGAQALFIIGDLFEYWLGDDGADPRLTVVYDAISAVVRSGTAVHLMHGNRDFLIGEQFAERVGATLHRDDHIEVSVADARFSLLHGDTLCTDDVDYLRLRSMVRDAQWQANFLSLSIEERIAQAQALRDKSRAAVAGKSQGIMDVNSHAVQSHFMQFPNNTLIHGHTHRPFDHTADRPAASGDQSHRSPRRVVLGDWRADHAMVARFDGQALHFERFN